MHAGTAANATGSGPTAQLCLTGGVSGGSGGGGSCSGEGEGEGESNRGAYLILVVSSVILGVGIVPMNTVGMTYIDDNVEREKVPLYIGERRHAHTRTHARTSTLRAHINCTRARARKHTHISARTHAYALTHVGLVILIPNT